MKRTASLVSTAFLAILLQTMPQPLHAAWSLVRNGDSVIATTAKGRLALSTTKAHSNGVWGHLRIGVSVQQIDALRLHRYDKYFPIIPVLLDIDGVSRQSNAKVDDVGLCVIIELDAATWDDMKRGASLIITFPDGSHVKTTLQGTRDAIATIEKAASAPR